MILLFIPTSQAAWVEPVPYNPSLRNVFQSDCAGITVRQAPDGSGGWLFSGNGTCEITVNKGQFKKLDNNVFLEGWHRNHQGAIERKVYLVQDKGNKWSILMGFSENCLNCFSGTTTLTQTGMTNGSWINLSSVNVTSVIATFLGLPDTSNWDNTSFLYRVSNNILNGSRPYQLSLNVSNTTGTSNNTWLYTNGRCMVSNCSDIVFYQNGGKLAHWVETNISPSGVVVWVNVTGNGTVNLYYGNSIATSSSNGNNTFLSWHGSATTDFLDSSLVQQPFFFEAVVTRTSGGSTDEAVWGVSDHATPRDSLGNSIFNLIYGTQNQRWIQAFTSGSLLASGSDTPTYPQNIKKRIKITVPSSTQVILHTDGYATDLSATGTVPTVQMRLVMQVLIGTATQDWSFVRSYASPGPVWATWSSEQSQLTNVYAQPQGHPTSENKTTNQTSVTINLTLTEGTPLQYIQLFKNTSGTFNATVTLYYTENTINDTDSASNGWYRNNGSHTAGINGSGWVNLTITNNAFLIAQYRGNATLSSNDPNATLQYNNPYLNISLGSVNTSATSFWNISIPYNNAPTGTFSNEACTFGQTCNKAYTASDLEGNPINRSMSINSIQKWDNGNGYINWNGLAAGNYLVTLWLNETATISSQNVSYTAWLNISASRITYTQAARNYVIRS